MLKYRNQTDFCSSDPSLVHWTQCSGTLKTPYWSAHQGYPVAQYLCVLGYIDQLSRDSLWLNIKAQIFVHILISSPDISVAQYSCVKQYWSAHDKKYGSVFAHIDQLFRDYLRLNISLCFGNIDQLNRDSLWLNINALIVSFQKIWLQYCIPCIQPNRDHLWLKRYTALSFWSAWIEILSTAQ